MTVLNSAAQAGDFNLEKLILTSHTGISENLDGFLVELNIYEDMFSNFIYGDIVLSDSLNLIRQLPIKGQETLELTLKTPGLENKIERTFKVFSITDRKVVRDTNTQVYRLNFCSQEGYANNIKILWGAYNGTISDIIQQIYDKNIKVSTDLQILTKTKNKAKFVSNGQTPYQIINWLANKSQPAAGAAANMFFYETCSSAYLASAEDLISRSRTMGKYTSAPAGMPSINYEESLRRIISFDVSKTSDFLGSQLTGYLGSRSISVDMIRKQFSVKDYDHVKEWEKYKHLSPKNEEIPLFRNDAARNSAVVRRVFPIHPNLHSSVANNLNEKEPGIYGNRLSHLHELTNFKLNMTVPGRTDMEVGNKIEVRIPDTNPPKSTDTVKDKSDVYSGLYLITAIHHKINPKNHSCILEVIRDSMIADRNA